MKDGIAGKVFGGRGKTVGEKNKIYLGGELNFDLTSNLDFGVGASFIPGYMLSETTMLYGRVGVQANKFNNYGQSLHLGSQVGFGAQTVISKNLDLRAEYTSLSTENYKSKDQVAVGLVYNFS